MFARLAVAVKMRMLLSQRSFLALAVIALTLACCLNDVKAQQPAARPARAAAVGSGKPAAAATGRSPKVIIVGAGLAGVAAARDLVDAGVKDVLVLEARSRPGGRLHSVKTKAGSVDLGAMWIHEAHPSNPLYSLARDQLKIPLSDKLDYMTTQAFKVNGGPEEVGTFLAAYMGIETIMDPKVQAARKAEQAALKAKQTPPADRPMYDVYSQYVAENKKDWQTGQAEATNALTCIGVQNLLNANITRASALRFGDAKSLPATDVHLKPGFDAVPLRLLPGIRVSYNTVVKGVTDKGSSVSVSLANGTELTADYVIVTVPLGVLKEGTIKFSPPLPAEKQTAIKNMGMGLLNKVVLVFDDKDVFWDQKVDFVIIASPDISCKWTAWLSYHKIFKMPVLVALNPADTARAMEAQSDKEVVQEALKKLRQKYKNVPNPVESYVTRWASDPWARGAYSYYAVGNPASITETLAAPHGRILFAGEATSSKMATALGALLSGRREAQRITKLAGMGPTVTEKAKPTLLLTTNKP